MSNSRPRSAGYRGALLLASTSLLTLAFAATPLTVDLDPGTPGIKSAQADSSCFVAGCKVLMADGRLKAIEEIAAGDLVVGRQGRVNRVLGVERVSLGARRLYAFNGGPAFVTAEHPFLTPGGWKAVDPEATHRENAALAVAALAVGDLLARAHLNAVPQSNGATALAPGLTVAYDELRALAAVEADPATPLFNLLLDGDHSYVVEGYVVHNKGGDDDGGGDDHGSGDDGGGDDGGGDDGGDDNGGEGGESGDDDGGHDDGGESGESGESGPGSANSGSGSSSSGPGNATFIRSGSGAPRIDDFDDLRQIGPDLTQDEEKKAIESGWQ